jgi:pilus assembly protein CpaB
MVAKQDIKEMDTINEKNLEYKSIPKTFLEPGSVYADPNEKDEEARSKDIRRFVGTIAVVPIRKGEQISYSKITEPSVRTGLAPQVAPGRRAVSIGITELTGVSKLLKPGDRVDLIGVFDMGGGRENRFAKTLLQDVVVLAVGRSLTNNPSRTVEYDPVNGKEKIRSLSEDVTFNTVTVEVEPSQAPALALIQSGGDAQIFLALRHNDDSDRINTTTLSLRDLVPEASRGGGRLPAGR